MSGTRVTVVITDEQIKTGLLELGDRKDGKPPVSLTQAVQQVLDEFLAPETDGSGGSIG